MGTPAVGPWTKYQTPEAAQSAGQPEGPWTKYQTPVQPDAQPAPAQPAQPTMGADPKAADAPMFGYSWQTPQQRMTMPLAKTLMAAHDKLKEVENYTQEGEQEHPIQSKIGKVANAIEGFLWGNPQHQESAIGSGQTGMLTNPVTASLLPGAEGEPALASAIKGGGNLIDDVTSVIKGGASKVAGSARQIVQGAEAAQEPAQAAIRSAVGAGEDTPMLNGNKTVLDNHLANLKAQESAAYKKLDDAAGFDVKELRNKMSNDQYKLKQLGNTDADKSAAEKLNSSIEDAKTRIADAEKKVGAAGIDPKEADNLFKSRKAGEDLKKALVSATSPDGETVNVDKLMEGAKKLRFNKYGDRLSQYLGKEGADELLHKLQAAQDLGQSAVKKQQIAKWVTGGVGLAGVEEAVRHTLP